VDEVLRTANNFYDAIGYAGPLELSFEVDNANAAILATSLGPSMWRERTVQCVDQKIAVDIQTSAFALLAERRQIILTVSRRLYNAFGTHVDDALVVNFVTEESGVPLEENA
jgi:hypothetical protein